jgi:tRNA (cytidine/uridine-2'-O-)-methyltransferase
MLYAPAKMIHVALIEPEIPWNTGNVGRTSLAAGAKLHLVRPLGFALTEQAVRRAGLDYWKHVDPVMHDGYEAFIEAVPKLGTPFALETYGSSSLYACDFPEDVVLIFGREKTGLPSAVREAYRDRLFRIPMFSEHVRSLNLATCVAISVYEVIRQHQARGWRQADAPAE